MKTGSGVVKCAAAAVRAQDERSHGATLSGMKPLQVVTAASTSASRRDRSWVYDYIFPSSKRQQAQVDLSIDQYPYSRAGFTLAEEDPEP